MLQYCLVLSQFYNVFIKHQFIDSQLDVEGCLSSAGLSGMRDVRLTRGSLPWPVVLRAAAWGKGRSWLFSTKKEEGAD